MNVNMKEPLWVERYRPTRVEDCILPERIKRQFTDIVARGEIPNMILSGGPGTGKTTVARAMCAELGVDYIVINTSEDTGIDTLRGRIRDFASTASLMSDKRKCVILDEFDYASPNLQAGLRNAFEQFSKTCSFIMTCNYPNRIMEAIFSRATHISYEIKNDELPPLQAAFYKRCVQILNNEKVPFDPKSLIGVIAKYFPDNRRILGLLQTYSAGGAIDEGVLMTLNDVDVKPLIEAIRAKKFPEIRQWAVQNAQNDLSALYTKLYKAMLEVVDSKSIPELILILEDYQRYDSVVPDRELHVAAMCVNIMVQVTFK